MPRVIGSLFICQYYVQPDYGELFSNCWKSDMMIFCLQLIIQEARMANSFKKLALGAILAAFATFVPSLPVSAQTCNPAVQNCS